MNRDNGIRGMNVSFDLFIDGISSNLNFLMSDALNAVLTSVLESQIQNVLNIEPVEIPIEKKRRFCCYKRALSKQGKSPTDDVCSICLKKYTNKSKVVKPDECDHLFHFKCLQKWLEHKPTCPVCRKICFVNLNRNQHQSHM